MEQLSHLIYASAAVKPFNHEQLVSLLENARAANGRIGVTGVLLHAQGSFFQVLEGDRGVLDALFAEIARDSRHANVVSIIVEPIQRRSFADWSMGFTSLTPAEVAGISGANDFFSSASCFSQLNPGRARKLLAAFARGSWHTRSSSAA
jgi:hypothetical protein